MVMYGIYNLDTLEMLTDNVHKMHNKAPIGLYTICIQNKLRSLVSSLTLQQIREVGAITRQEHVSITYDIECTCKIQWYTICMLSLLILGIVVSIIINARKLKMFKDICSQMQLK